MKTPMAVVVLVGCMAFHTLALAAGDRHLVVPTSRPSVGVVNVFLAEPGLWGDEPVVVLRASGGNYQLRPESRQVAEIVLSNRSGANEGLHQQAARVAGVPVIGEVHCRCGLTTGNSVMRQDDLPQPRKR